MKRKAQVISWKYGYTNNLLNVVTSVHNAVDYRGGKFYHDKEDNETITHLFYGNKPTKKEIEEKGLKTYPIKDYSYEELAMVLANKFLLDKRAMKCLNSGYDFVGCSCSIEARTVNRKRIPIIKAIFILGGKRINF